MHVRATLYTFIYVSNARETTTQRVCRYTVMHVCAHAHIRVQCDGIKASPR
jgi:hypothetical protein